MRAGHSTDATSYQKSVSPDRLIFVALLSPRPLDHRCFHPRNQGLWAAPGLGSRPERLDPTPSPLQGEAQDSARLPRVGPSRSDRRRGPRSGHTPARNRPRPRPPVALEPALLRPPHAAGGARPCSNGSSFPRSLGWRRMRSTTVGSVITETTFSCEPQPGHTSGSTSNTRLSSRAQEAREALAPDEMSEGSGGFARACPARLASRPPRVRFEYHA